MSTASPTAPAITPQTVLVRAHGVVVQLDNADFVTLTVGGERYILSSYVLALLHAFAYPRPVSEVLESTAGGAEHWMEMSAAVLRLVRLGVLHTPEEGGSPAGIARPAMHVVMLDDEHRTKSYMRAIEAVVTDRDTVLDIGTGSGILAATAARRGAARVFAIESEAIGDAAERVFRANGLADRVTLLRGRSTNVSLPARADVLVTEIIGNDPLDELLLEVVADAKARLLVAEPRIVPSALEVLAVAVDVPKPVLERHVFTEERVRAWREAYGFDLSPLLAIRLSSSQPVTVRTREMLEWPVVAEPALLSRIDLLEDFDVVQRARTSIVLDRDVERLGILLAFRATLAPGISLSTLPADVDPKSSWRYALWPALDRLTSKRGETVHVDWAYDRGSTTIVTS